MSWIIYATTRQVRHYAALISPLSCFVTKSPKLRFTDSEKRSVRPNVRVKRFGIDYDHQ
jgi:hypothetical protein